MKKLISLVIPCYNEEESLNILYDALVEVSEQMDQYDMEYLFVDDGSKDKTLEKMVALAEKDARVRYISFARNFGKEAAMYAGFANAKGDYVTTMDSDMQDPPSLLPKMAAILDEGEYDCVATRRVTREGEPPIRSFFARTFYKIINKISDANVVDGARDFRLMRREMVDTIVSMEEESRFSKGIFGWVGFKTYWISYENIERAAGETKWSFWSLTKYAIDGIVNFSQMPLLIPIWTGIVFTLISIVEFLTMGVQKKVFGKDITDVKKLTGVVTMVAGIEMTCMGIIGYYMAKIFREVKQRPHYIVGKTNIEDVVKK